MGVQFVFSLSKRGLPLKAWEPLVSLIYYISLMYYSKTRVELHETNSTRITINENTFPGVGQFFGKGGFSCSLDERQHRGS